MQLVPHAALRCLAFGTEIQVLFLFFLNNYILICSGSHQWRSPLKCNSADSDKHSYGCPYLISSTVSAYMGKGDFAS